MQDKLGDKARLFHIRDSIEKINQYVNGVDFKTFERHSMLMDACVRQLGIIGEASNRLSNEIKEQNKDIEWKQIIGLRNIVIHQYFGIDDKVLWEVIQDNIPDLQIKITRIIEALE